MNSLVYTVKWKQHGTIEKLYLESLLSVSELGTTMIRGTADIENKELWVE